MWIKLKDGSYFDPQAGVRLGVQSTLDVGYRVFVHGNTAQDATVESGYADYEEAAEALDDLINQLGDNAEALIPVSQQGEEPTDPTPVKAAKSTPAKANVKGKE